MSNREYIINLISNMPDSQLPFIINIIEGINGFINKSDAYDLQLSLDGEIDNDEEYTAEEVNKILGLNI